MMAPGKAPFVVAGPVPLVFLDANVLLPQYLRSVFLELAYAEMLVVHWGQQVLEEVRRNLLRPRFGKTPEQVDRLFVEMGRAFPNALVHGSAQFEAEFAGKVDDGDMHVAASALRLSRTIYGGQAVVLITSNTRHLPTSAFEGTQVWVSRPGTFLKALLESEPRVATVLHQMVQRFHNPPMRREDLLTVLDRSGSSNFATALGEAWGLERG
jgi:predicted nucleic acid-binding protein